MLLRILLFCVLTSSAISAQVTVERRIRPADDSARPGATIRVDKDVVLVPVGVVDQSNHPVTGLGKDNFRVFDNKVEQRLLSLTADDEPLAVGLVFDTSGSIGKNLRRLRMAAKAFLIDTTKCRSRLFGPRWKLYPTHLLGDYSHHRNNLVV